MFTTITIVLRANNEVDPVFMEKKFDNVIPPSYLKEGSEIFITVNEEEYLCKIFHISWQMPANEINIYIRPNFVVKEFLDLMIKTVHFMSDGWKICPCNTNKKIIEFIKNVRQ